MKLFKWNLGFKTVVLSSILVVSTPSSNASATVQITASDGDVQVFSTENIKWKKHGYRALSESNVEWHICQEHFPQGSDAWKEIEKAAQYYNRLPGGQFNIKLVPMKHKTKAELFPEEGRDVSMLDYVDNDDAGVFPCHKDGGTKCGDTETDDGWVMNTCHAKSKGGLFGRVKSFVISVNSHCKKHSADKEAVDYPKAPNIGHELGHAFGMKHAPSWPVQDRNLISTMEGNLEILSAYDHAFLDHFYGNIAKAESDIVVSPDVRMPISGKPGKFHNHPFEQVNPSVLYLDESGIYKDCKTKRAPKFHFSWFNLGQKADVSVEFNVFGKHGEETKTGFLHKSSVVKNMPSFSDGMWTLEVTANQEDFGVKEKKTERQVQFIAKDVIEKDIKEQSTQNLDLILFSEESKCRRR